MSESASAGDGRYAWIVCVASLLLVLFGQGALFVLNVELKPISESMGWPRELPSLGYAAAFFGAGIGALFFGPLSERIGMGNVALFGAIAIGTGVFLTGYVETPAQLLLVFGVLVGLLGNACMFAPLVANVTRWFVRKRGLALGIATAGQSLGGVIWPHVITWLDELVGWRDTFHIYGLLCFACMIPVTFLLRRRPPAAQGAGGGDATDGLAFGMSPSAATSVLCFAIVCCCIPMSVPLVHLKAHGTDLGFTPQQGASLLSLALFASLASRVLGGMLADRVGGIRALLIGSVIQCLMLFAISQLRDFTALAVVCVVYGLGYGGIIAMYAYIVREHFPLARMTQRIAWVYLFGTLGMAVGGWLGGWLFDRTGSYEAAFIAAGAVNLGNLAIVGGLLLLTHRRNRRVPV